MAIPAVLNRDPEPIDIRVVRGDDFTAILEVEGDRSADTFAAAFRRVGSATVVAFTSAVAGAYVPLTDVTPVTLSFTDTISDALGVTIYDRYFWSFKWTVGAAEATIAAGRMYVKEKVVA